MNGLTKLKTIQLKILWKNLNYYKEKTLKSIIINSLKENKWGKKIYSFKMKIYYRIFKWNIYYKNWNLNISNYDILFIKKNEINNFHRIGVIHWLISFCEKFYLLPETFYLSINLFEEYF